MKHNEQRAFSDEDLATLARYGLSPEASMEDSMRVLLSLADQVLEVDPDFKVDLDLVHQ